MLQITLNSRREGLRKKRLGDYDLYIISFGVLVCHTYFPCWGALVHLCTSYILEFCENVLQMTLSAKRNWKGGDNMCKIFY